jgi:hypothetical protein
MRVTALSFALVVTLPVNLCFQRQLNMPVSSSIHMNLKWGDIQKNLVSVIMLPLIFMGSNIVHADDELAKFAAEGNAVTVDGECFMKKCSLETSSCASDQTCLKGLSCLAR